MCEKTIRKIKKGSHVARLREARRMERLQRLNAPVNVVARSLPASHAVDKAAQNRVIIELALRTLMLMQKNKLIQEKIVELKKETNEFVANLLKNPENQKRYSDNLKLHGVSPPPQAPPIECSQK